MKIIRFFAKRRLNYLDCAYIPVAIGVWHAGWYWTSLVLVLGLLTSALLEVIAEGR